MKQLLIHGKDQPGILAKVARILGSNGINIENISAGTINGEGVISLLTNDSITARKQLEKSDFVVQESDMLLFELIDRPGELAKISEMISKEGINIESAFVLSKGENKSTIAFKLDDHGRARKLFRKYIV